MSRQQEWQKKQRELGNCTICGEPAEGLARCPECAIKARKSQRKRYGYNKWKPGSNGRPPIYPESPAK